MGINVCETNIHHHSFSFYFIPLFLFPFLFSPAISLPILSIPFSFSLSKTYGFLLLLLPLLNPNKTHTILCFLVNFGSKGVGYDHLTLLILSIFLPHLLILVLLLNLGLIWFGSKEKRKKSARVIQGLLLILSARYMLMLCCVLLCVWMLLCWRRKP